LSQKIKDRLKNFAQTLGFDALGVAQASTCSPYANEVRHAHEEGRFGPLDYLSLSLESRLDITKAFPDAKSVIVVVKNYYKGDHGPDAQGHAKIARYAWGKDYHQWFKKRLRDFEPFLANIARQKIGFWAFNDTRPVLERAWAHKAGLGFIGKSAMFIHRDFGTWTLLGGFATDLEIEPDQSYHGPDCGSCTRCLDACPTKAIIEPHTVDANKCIATWTIERPLHKDAFAQAPRDHAWGFGCDICQEVCPWNKFQQITDEERFTPIKGRVYFTHETFGQDLRGSPLFRSRKAGLMANYLRIRRSLKENSLKIFNGDDLVVQTLPPSKKAS
jgi:epoxyqueuosine reductase